MTLTIWYYEVYFEIHGWLFFASTQAYVLYGKCAFYTTAVYSLARRPYVYGHLLICMQSTLAAAASEADRGRPRPPSGPEQARTSQGHPLVGFGGTNGIRLTSVAFGHFPAPFPIDMGKKASDRHSKLKKESLAQSMRSDREKERRRRNI